MLITELSLKELFRARDAVVMLKDLGFDDDWLWNLEKQIKDEIGDIKTELDYEAGLYVWW